MPASLDRAATLRGSSPRWLRTVATLGVAIGAIACERSDSESRNGTPHAPPGPVDASAAPASDASGSPANVVDAAPTQAADGATPSPDGSGTQRLAPYAPLAPLPTSIPADIPECPLVDPALVDPTSLDVLASPCAEPPADLPVVASALTNGVLVSELTGLAVSPTHVFTAESFGGFKQAPPSLTLLAIPASSDEPPLTLDIAGRSLIASTNAFVYAAPPPHLTSVGPEMVRVDPALQGTEEVFRLPADETFRDIAAAGRRVVWTTYDGVVARVFSAEEMTGVGPLVPVLARQSESTAAALMTDGIAAFWWEGAGSIPGNSTLWRADASAASPILQVPVGMYGYVTSATTEGEVLVAVNDEGTPSRLCRQHTDGSWAVVLARQHEILHLRAFDGAVYWFETNYECGEVWMMRPGAPATRIARVNDIAAEAAAGTGAYFFLTPGFANALLRADAPSP